MGTARSRPGFEAQMGGARPDAPVGAPSEAATGGGAPARVATLAGGAAFVVDLELRVLAAEGDALRAAGLDPRALLGRPFGEILDPVMAARLEPPCRLALLGHTFAYEHEAEGRAYLSRGLPLRDPSGTIYAALAVTYDVTDRKQVEALQRRSEETFSSLIEHAPFAIFVVDALLRIRAVNPRAEALFGGTGPLLGRDFGEAARAVWPEPFAADVVGRVRRTLATGEPYVAPCPAEPFGAAGPMTAYDWQLQRLTLPDGAAAVVCYAYDVSALRQAERDAARATVARTRAEARLQDSETRLTLALEASGMGTFVWHLADGRAEPDARTLELFGLGEPGSPPVAALETLLEPQSRSRLADAVRRAFDPASSGALREDVCVHRPDGTDRWLSVSARVLFAGEPPQPVRVAGVVADIDERKRVEESLRAVGARLTDADRRKDEFLAVLAHELRNPLAPIRAGLELIRLGGDAAAVERTRAIMERQVGHMVRLIDDLLDVSRITSGKIQLQRRATSLDALVATAVDANREAVHAARLRLRIDLPEPPVCVDADPTRVVQVISNVIHNAVKFTDAGGEIRITGAGAPPAGEPPAAALTIADSGMGISAEMLPRVFELFAQDRAASTRASTGLGIGLALARRLMELHGGSIEARSEGPGLGSAFTIRLPLAVAASEPLPAARARLGRPPRRARRRRA
jgi:PAS domain S-box-containing protein